jgi:hypothetical protein
MQIDPLAPGQQEQVTPRQQPNPNRLPYFTDVYDPVGGMSYGWFLRQDLSHAQGFARPTPGSATIRRVILAGGGGNEHTGFTRVYVAAGGNNRVQIFDPQTLKDLGSFGPNGVGASPDVSWQSIQSITYQRITDDHGEVFVLGYRQGSSTQEIRVFDEDGHYKAERQLAALPSFLGPFDGMDAGFGELWLTVTPARDGTADLLGQRVVVIDATTGAIKGLGLQPLADKKVSDSNRSWWDISIAPELGGAIVDNRFFQPVNSLLPGLLAGGSPLCEASAYYACASTNQRGTDAVAGMNWFLELPSYADNGTNRPVQEYSIDSRKTVIDASLLHQLLGSAISVDQPGYYLTPKRTWVTQQQHQGDTVSLSDLLYNARDPRLDWYGLLKTSHWLRGQKCVGYVVSKGDIYVAGDQGEREFELVDNLSEIDLLIDGHQVDSATNPASDGTGTNPDDVLCFDTHSVSNGPHTLTIEAHLKDDQGGPNGPVLTAENRNLRIDNKPPDQTFDPLPPFVRDTVQLKGTSADPHAGLGDWQAQILRPGRDPGNDSNWETLPDGQDPSTGANQPCSGQFPDESQPGASVNVGCPWPTHQGECNTNQLFPDGPYQVRLRSRDWASDDGSVEPVQGTPNDPNDDGNVATLPQSTVVDNTCPTLNLSGDLANYLANGALINTRIYPLVVDAHDGGSGVVSIDIQVDGVSQDRGQWSCPQGGCDRSLPYNLVAGNFSEGYHTLQVVVQDQVGWTKTTTLPFYLDYILPAEGDPGASTGTSSTAGSQSVAPAVQSPRALETAEVQAGVLLPCTAPDQPANFTTYSLGSDFDGFSLSISHRECDLPNPNEVASLIPGSYLRSNFVSFAYGDCQPAPDADSPDCSPPLEIQSWPICERNASSYPLPQWAGIPELPRAPTEFRDVPAALFDEVMRVGEQSSSTLSQSELDESDGLRIEIYTGDTTIVIFADDATVARDAADAVRAQLPDQPPTAGPDPTGGTGSLPPPLPGAMKGALQCSDALTKQATAAAQPPSAALTPTPQAGTGLR